MIGSFIPARKLSFSEITLLPEAILLLFIYRLKVSYQASRKWMPAPVSETSHSRGEAKIGKALLIATIINGLENRTPWKNTCLVKALATRKMLERRSYDNTLHIGVTPTPDKKFRAHAWLSIGGTNILGGEHLDGFFEISGFQ
ncbi:transglutaminase superfamily protein [Gramella sp. Hel_I_59]|uniref:lasso peptide biosynthesis B2 protein n=1 Tax=Gramella sp. Hel_I_59 TaxID=1249978 RepID=UPI001153E66F|nr:lasso peptide biosynthesis B2 protein [Gramella sp. Hel_I_59]TQI71969.1 transglutaminase superfamily protein [Gramella sp. Hel_I_59]